MNHREQIAQGLHERLGMVWKPNHEGFLSLKEHVQNAEGLAAANGGTLPSYSRLQKAGHQSLTVAMGKHPKAFSHIPQEKLRKPLEERVREAERLAEENGGSLPSPSWLVKNGHAGLLDRIHANESDFAHIPQERVVKRLANLVKQAEHLRDENGGILPHRSQLIRSGHTHLVSRMRKHPKAFAHIVQDKKRKPLIEQVLSAETLATENGGSLPTYGWLKANRHHGIINAMRSHPEAFAHLSQDTKRKTVEDYVRIAEQAAEEHGGILPGPAWLQRNGLFGLRKCMGKYPESFSHIVQAQNWQKSVGEHLVDAEDIAAKNGGVLPGALRLRKDGHSDLTACMRHHPEAFEHISRMFRGKIVEPQKEAA